MLAHFMSFDLPGIVDLTHDLIFKIDLSDRILNANKPARTILGYAGDEFFGLPFHQLVAIDNREEWEMCLETVSQNVPVQGANLTLLTKEGKPLRVEGSMHLSPGPDEPHVYAFFRSLSEQQEAQQALRESERRLRTVMSALPDVLLVLDDEGRYRQVYTANHKLLVAHPDQLQGKSLYDFLPRAKADEGMAVVRHVIHTQRSEKCEYSLEIRSKTRWFSARVVPFGTERDPRVLWVARDITDLYLARQQLQEDEKLLRSLLELETKAREVVAYEIHDGFVQHAIGTQMWLQHLIASANELPPQAAEALHIACDSVNQAVEDARSMIRDLRPVVVDGKGLAKGLRQLVAVMQQESTIPLEFHCTIDPPPLLRLLEGQVFRIVQESLHNVIRHSQAKRAEIRLCGTAGELHLEICDDGVGFEPGEVGPDHYGLEGIRRRASVFGGNARVDSGLGRGTRIRVTLPILAPEPKPNSPSPP